MFRKELKFFCVAFGPHGPTNGAVLLIGGVDSVGSSCY